MSAEAENEISVRQWLEKYYACLRGPRDFATQFENDWYYSNFSDNNEMHRHISCFVKLLAAITDPYILDNYYIWFYQHCMPFSGKQYDDIRFDPLSGKRNGQYFTVKLNHAGRKKWSLYSERFGFLRRSMSARLCVIWPKAYDCGKHYSKDRGYSLTGEPNTKLVGVYRFKPGLAEATTRDWYGNVPFTFIQRQDTGLVKGHWNIHGPFAANADYGVGYDVIGLEEIQKSPFGKL